MCTAAFYGTSLLLSSTDMRSSPTRSSPALTFFFLYSYDGFYSNVNYTQWNNLVACLSSRYLFLCYISVRDSLPQVRLHPRLLIEAHSNIVHVLLWWASYPYGFQIWSSRTHYLPFQSHTQAAPSRLALVLWACRWRLTMKASWFMFFAISRLFCVAISWF